MIELRNLCKTHRAGDKPAVHGLDLSIATGEFLVLIGPSGCGKTTTLSMINRLVEPSSGEILVDNVSVQSLDPVVLRRSMGFVFQDIGLFPHLTAAENVGITLKLMKRPPSEIEARVEHVMDQMRVPQAEFGHRFPRTLSGGQRQRIGLARALAAGPAIMLMDEPFGALDPLTRENLGPEYRALHDRLGLTTVLVTHDMTEAILLADRIAIMREGALVQAGTPREIATSPANDFVRAMMESPRRRATALTQAMQAGAAP